MKIENLSKELETQDMTDVHGGTALTGQVVPTNVQCNAAGQTFNVGSCAPVALDNSADQSNYSSQSTFDPVGSVIVTLPRCAD
jgi:hypothetical protein